jgi:hypothetical protein
MSDQEFSQMNYIRKVDQDFDEKLLATCMSLLGVNESRSSNITLPYVQNR